MAFQDSRDLPKKDCPAIGLLPKDWPQEGARRTLAYSPWGNITALMIGSVPSMIPSMTSRA